MELVAILLAKVDDRFEIVVRGRSLDETLSITTGPGPQEWARGYLSNFLQCELSTFFGDLEADLGTMRKF